MPNFFRERGEYIECPREWLRKSRDLEESLEDRCWRIMDEHEFGMGLDWWLQEGRHRA